MSTVEWFGPEVVPASGRDLLVEWKFEAEVRVSRDAGRYDPTLGESGGFFVYDFWITSDRVLAWAYWPERAS